MGAPLSADELARFQAQFGLNQPMGPAAPIVSPAPMTPPTATPLADLKPNLAEGQAMPQSLGLQLPGGVGGGSAPVFTPAPGTTLDLTPLEPFAPKPKAPAGPPAPPPPSMSGGMAPMQLSYPPVRTVPGGYQPAARITEGAHQIPTEAKFDQMAGLTTQQDAVGVRGDAEQAGARKEFETLNALADRQNDFEAAQASAEARRAAAMQSAQSRYDVAVQKAAEQADVDPGRFWAERGAGVQLMAAIGVALGAAGAALTGGQNSAAQIVEAAIDRDLQAQRDNVAKAQGNVGAAKGVLAEMRGQFGDERQAELAAKDAMLATTATKLQAIAAETKSEDARARALDLYGQLQEKRGLLRQSWSATEEGNVKVSERYVPEHTVGGPPKGTPASDATDKRMVTMPDGTRYQMADDQDGTKARERVEAVGNLERIAAQLNKLRDDASTYIPGTENYAEAKRLGGQYMLAVKKSETLGTLDNGVTKFTEDTFGDPTGIFSRAGLRALGYAKDARENLNAFVKANGARVVKEDYGRDENGNVVPVQAFKAQSAANAIMPEGFRTAGGAPVARPKMPPIQQFDPDAVQLKLDARRGKGSHRR